MKKILIVLIAALSLLFVCAACSELTIAEIETSKAGKIDVGIFDQNVPAEKQDQSMQLTPIVATNDKSITDDGRGLYRIILDHSGEGTVSVDSTTVQAGTTVTVNATPANEWKLNVYLLDWQVVQSNTFVMPEHDVHFSVSFVSKRHSIARGGSGGGYILIEDDCSSAVEGTTLYFTIDENISDYWYYYEDEDVFVELNSQDETGNHQRVNVQKAGENRFRFVMPEEDCTIVMNRREFGKVEWVSVLKRNDWGELYPIDENEVANYISYTLTMDNAPLEVNTRVKRHVATLTINYLNQLYEVEDVRWDGRTDSTTKIDDAHYTFTVGYAYLYIILKNREVPSGSHSISTNNPEHGTIEAPAYASPNASVTVTVTSDDDYHLATLQYSYEQDVWNDIELQGDDYIFTMPDADVTVRATFSLIPATTGGLHVSVVGLDEYGYSLSDIFSEFILYYSEENYVIIDEIYDDMTLPVEIGKLSLFYYLREEEYQCWEVYFHNTGVIAERDDYYGRATFDIEEGDLNDDIVFHISLR